MEYHYRGASDSEDDMASHTNYQLGICTVHDLRAMVLNPDDGGENVRVTNEGLCAVYDGAVDWEGASSARTTTPIPRGTPLFYYEMYVKDSGRTDAVGLGVCTRDAGMNGMPGWSHSSYGYHGDDGFIFKEDGAAGSHYGPRYRTGDIIGCCLDFITGYCFFTKNGKQLPRAFELETHYRARDEWYPMVGFESKRAKAVLNFGQHPFIFNIRAYASKQRQRTLHAIKQRVLPSEYQLLISTVLSFLHHSGYTPTAHFLQSESTQVDEIPIERDPQLHIQDITQNVVRGDVEGALFALVEKLPLPARPQDNVVYLKFPIHHGGLNFDLVCAYFGTLSDPDEHDDIFDGFEIGSTSLRNLVLYNAPPPPPIISMNPSNHTRSRLHVYLNS